MKYTLLPPIEKRMLKREYHVRLAVVCCFLVAVSGIIGIVTLIPALTHSYLEEKNQLSAIASIKKGKDQDGTSALTAKLASDAALLNILSENKGGEKNSFIIGSIVALRGINHLTSIAIDRIGSSTVSITLQGNAPTREGLLTFKKHLEDLSPGNKVDLPVSELAKSTNIQFSLKLNQQLP
jgi:hypothetical protein